MAAMAQTTLAGWLLLSCLEGPAAAEPNAADARAIEACLKVRAEIEEAARQPISGFVGNANLIEETTAEQIIGGYEFAADLAAESGLPLEFITAPEDLVPELDVQRFKCPLLPIQRQLVPPWLRVRRFGST